MRIIIVIIIGSFLISCGSKNFRKLSAIETVYNGVNAKNTINLSKGSFNPSKDIFKRLGDSLSSNYIYVYSWVNHLPQSGTKHFSAVVYDYESDTTYYIANTLEKPKLIQITNSNDENLFLEEKFILKNYIEGKSDFLLAIKPKFISSEIGSDYYLLDSKLNTAYVFKNIILHNEGGLFNEIKR